jgi:hypothetical protein
VPIPRDLAASEAELPKHLLDEPQNVARASLVAALQRGDAQPKAAALLLSGLHTVDSDPQSLESSRKAQQSSLQALASSSKDPVVASWAYQRCGVDEVCQAKALELWLTLEPHNAVPWLAVLNRQPQRREEALRAMTRAASFQTHWGALPGAALESMPPEVLPYLQQGLLIEAIGISAAFSLPSFQGLFNMCKPAPPTGSTTQLRCDALAHLLVERSDTLVGYYIGLRIADLAGWPAEVTKARRAEANRWHQAAANFMDLQQLMSCDSVDKSKAWVRDVAKKGELATMRDRALAASSARR